MQNSDSLQNILHIGNYQEKNRMSKNLSVPPVRAKSPAPKGNKVKKNIIIKLVQEVFLQQKTVSQIEELSCNHENVFYLIQGV